MSTRRLTRKPRAGLQSMRRRRCAPRSSALSLCRERCERETCREGKGNSHALTGLQCPKARTRGPERCMKGLHKTPLFIFQRAITCISSREEDGECKYETAECRESARTCRPRGAAPPLTTVRRRARARRRDGKMGGVDRERIPAHRQGAEPGKKSGARTAKVMAARTRFNRMWCSCVEHAGACASCTPRTERTPQGRTDG